MVKFISLVLKRHVPKLYRHDITHLLLVSGPTFLPSFLPSFLPPSFPPSFLCSCWGECVYICIKIYLHISNFFLHPQISHRIIYGVNYFKILLAEWFLEGFKLLEAYLYFIVLWKTALDLSICVPFRGLEQCTWEGLWLIREYHDLPAWMQEQSRIWSKR